MSSDRDFSGSLAPGEGDEEDSSLPTREESSSSSAPGTRGPSEKPRSEGEGEGEATDARFREMEARIREMDARIEEVRNEVKGGEREGALDGLSVGLGPLDGLDVGHASNEDWKDSFLSLGDEVADGVTLCNDLDGTGASDMSIPQLDASALGFDGGGKLGTGQHGASAIQANEGSSSSESGGGKKKRKAKRSASRTKAKRPKDEKSSEAAKKRELDKFKRWQVNRPNVEPREWTDDGIAPDRIQGSEGERFIQFGKRVVTQAVEFGMKDHMATRLNDVLANGLGKSYAELFELSVLCCVPIKDGTRKTTYDKKHCAVCKAAGKMEPIEHNCPYCHDCYVQSGWKKKTVLRIACKLH